MANWLSQHSDILIFVGIGSFLLLCASLLATPWVLAKLPANYFSAPPSLIQRSAARVLFSAAKTVLGLAMVFAGMVMMFTPGPGLVCVVLGLALCEFPGKHNLMANLVKRPSVFSSLNWLRNKAGKPPFERPE